MLSESKLLVLFGKNTFLQKVENVKLSCYSVVIKKVLRTSYYNREKKYALRTSKFHSVLRIPTAHDTII